MWKLIKLHVDNLNANSYLQCALTDYVGLVLFLSARQLLFYEK